MKLRIALIAASREIIGGHSVQAEALATQLSNEGHDVTWMPIDARFPKALTAFRRVRFVRTIINELLYIASLHRIASADIVHIFSASYWSFLLGPSPAIVVAKLMRKPVVLHYHSGEAADHLKRWNIVVRPLLALVDDIVVPSHYLRDIFAGHGYEARVIPNVIELWRFRYRERAAMRPRLLSARNLESHYGIDTILRAFVHIQKRFSNATLTIVGQGSQAQALRDLAVTLGVSGVWFAGAVKPAGMPKVYDAADILVNASVIDNQPVSILEAFASGLPVVSTAIGDIPSMLRGGDAGVLAESNDVAVAEAVCRLLDQPEAAVAMARRAHEEAERYTWRRAGGEWNALYTSLLRSDAGEVLAHGA